MNADTYQKYRLFQKRLLTKMREERSREASQETDSDLDMERAEAMTEKNKAKAEKDVSVTLTEESGKEVVNDVIQVENYLEVNGDQIKVEDVVAKIIEAYDGEIKKLQTYYNFDERRCYYVVNDKAEGLFVEF